MNQFKPYLDFSKGARETYYLYFYNMDNYPASFVIQFFSVDS